MSAKVAPLPTSTGAVIELIGSAPIIPTGLQGWSVLAGAGGFVADLLDGDNTGKLLAKIQVDASKGQTFQYGEAIEILKSAMYLSIVSGAATGVIYYF